MAGDRESETDRRGSRRPARRPSLPVAELVREASEQFRVATGTHVDSVSAFARTDEGWQLQVETVEVARVPDTTSVLASFQVWLDEDGELIGYRRIRRYSRGQLDE